jgi:hypothetical protein
MTLEETTEFILAAVEAEDLASLQAASKLREVAMAALASMEPTLALRASVAASIAAGERAKRAIASIRQRIRGESRRLATIESGFVRAQQSAAAPHIDCKG